MTWYIWLFILEAVVIVTGNVTVLVVFTRTPALRKRKHFLLVSLAVADLFVGLISVPMYVRLSLARYTRIIQEIYSIQDSLFGTASVIGLTAVAIERAYAVYFPFKHRTLWKGVYVIGITVIWVMAACAAFGSFYFGDELVFICAVTVPFALFLATIVISYLLIWVKINCMTSVQVHEIQGRDNRLTITLLIVTVISLIAWIPFQVINLYAKLCPECLTGESSLLVTAKFLHYCNSLVNPIIYALRMPQFKTAVFNAVRCCQQQLALQVPNERSQPNRARVIPLTTNYNMAFDPDDCQDHAVRDETQRNDNTKTTQVPPGDEIQMNDTHL